MRTMFNKNKLLALAIASVASINVAVADGHSKKSEKHMYKDSATGEVKDTKKSLSKMSDTEKASLSNEEYQSLKESEKKKALKEKKLGDIAPE